ncbi:MAG TPA: hypothetical protein VE687_13535 [Stellaceae bacterium]|jgi:hypothetical protein|nr:hypothetical protein [Stellaceae bacterium]
MSVIDTLKLARALRDKGGFAPEAAEATAEALNEAFGEQLATRIDVERLGERLDHRINQLGSELRKEMSDMRGEILKWAVGIVGFQTVAILGGVAGLIHLLK